MNAKLAEKLSDVRSRLSDLVRRITDEVSTTGHREDEKNYFASLHTLVLDDITYVDSIADALKAGYLLHAQEALAAVEVTVNSDPHAKYNPVMHQLRLEGLAHSLSYMLYAIRKVKPDASFTHAMKTISLRLDVPQSVGITRSLVIGNERAYLRVTSDFGARYGIRDYTELLAYLTISSSGFLCLGKVRSIDTADDLVTSYDHNADELTKAYENSFRLYNEFFDKVDPTKPENMMRDALYRVSVLNERIEITNGELRLLRSQLATHKLETDKAIEIASATVNRRADDNIIVGMLAVILLFFIILSFLH